MLYNAFCSDIAACVYADSRADSGRIASAISLPKGLPLKDGTEAAELSQGRRQLFRRVAPDPAELDRRLAKLIDTYRGREDGKGDPYCT